MSCIIHRGQSICLRASLHKSGNSGRNSTGASAHIWACASQSRTSSTADISPSRKSHTRHFLPQYPPHRARVHSCSVIEPNLTRGIHRNDRMFQVSKRRNWEKVTFSKIERSDIAQSTWQKRESELGGVNNHHRVKSSVPHRQP